MMETHRYKISFFCIMIHIIVNDDLTGMGGIIRNTESNSIVILLVIMIMTVLLIKDEITLYTR